ncbi:MAG: hypothetical protein Q9220_003530 [cf. Caloplaca sp. 1 TL-2023]
MGLNGLVLRNVVAYVKKLKLVGDVKEHDLDECSRKGRVPDSSMMLSTLVRVAIERATSLKELSYAPLRRFRGGHPANMLQLGTEYKDAAYSLARSCQLAASKPHSAISIISDSQTSDDSPAATEPVKNLFSYDDGSCTEYNDSSLIEEVTSLNSTGGHGDTGGSAFIDNNLKKLEVSLPRLRMIRGDKVSKELVFLLAHTSGLERLYIVGPKKTDKNDGSNGYPQSPTSEGSSPASEQAADNLRDEHVEAITRNHGQTLRHLLLPPQWRLTSDNIALIIRQCPNLEQLGFGADFDKFTNMRLLMPFLPKVTAIRILDNPDSSDFRDKMHEIDDGRHEKAIGSSTSAREWSKIRWMQLADLLFEAGEVELMEDPDQPGKMAHRRHVQKQSLEAVKDVAIWRMDSLDVF